jgi:hypothetical protein
MVRPVLAIIRGFININWKHYTFAIHIYIQVTQEEGSIFWEVIVSVILRKFYMNMCPILNGFRYLARNILNLARNIYLPSRRNAPLPEACESV